MCQELPVLPEIGEDENTVNVHLAAMTAKLDRADRVHPGEEMLLDRQKRTLSACTQDLKSMTT